MLVGVAVPSIRSYAVALLKVIVPAQASAAGDFQRAVFHCGAADVPGGGKHGRPSFAETFTPSMMGVINCARGRNVKIDAEIVIEHLPAGFHDLRAEARAEGFRQIERLATE